MPMMPNDYHIASRKWWSDKAWRDETVDANVRVTDSESVTVNFHYPLGKSTSFTHHKAGGFTVADLANIVTEGYYHIYAAPNSYDVWGHGIGDLILEGYRIDTSTKVPTVTLSVGS